MLKAGKISSCVSTTEMLIPTGTLFLLLHVFFFLLHNLMFGWLWFGLVVGIRVRKKMKYWIGSELLHLLHS